MIWPRSHRASVPAAASKSTAVTRDTMARHARSKSNSNRTLDNPCERHYDERRYGPGSLVFDATKSASKGNTLSSDPELLTGLSDGELEALAEGMLAPAIQSRLDELIARSKEAKLASVEQAELDRLLMRVDQLTLIKTRARYTIRQQQAGVSRS